QSARAVTGGEDERHARGFELFRDRICGLAGEIDVQERRIGASLLQELKCLLHAARVPDGSGTETRQHVLEQERDDRLVLHHKDREPLDAFWRSGLLFCHPCVDSGISMRQRKPVGSKSTTAMPCSCWTIPRSSNLVPKPRSPGELTLGPPVSIQTRYSV